MCYHKAFEVPGHGPMTPFDIALDLYFDLENEEKNKEMLAAMGRPHPVPQELERKRRLVREAAVALSKVDNMYATHRFTAWATVVSRDRYTEVLEKIRALI